MGKLCLAHKPSTITSKHYRIPNQEQFDNAIKWLGEQLGIEEGFRRRAVVIHHPLPIACCDQISKGRFGFGRAAPILPAGLP